jgi:ribulose bisphosphate carboxylase small subunit
MFNVPVAVKSQVIKENLLLSKFWVLIGTTFHISSNYKNTPKYTNVFWNNWKQALNSQFRCHSSETSGSASGPAK